MFDLPTAQRFSKNPSTATSARVRTPRRRSCEGLQSRPQRQENQWAPPVSNWIVTRWGRQSKLARSRSFCREIAPAGSRGSRSCSPQPVVFCRAGARADGRARHLRKIDLRCIGRRQRLAVAAGDDPYACLPPALQPDLEVSAGVRLGHVVHVPKIDGDRDAAQAGLAGSFAARVPTDPDDRRAPIGRPRNRRPARHDGCSDLHLRQLRGPRGRILLGRERAVDDPVACAHLLVQHAANRRRFEPARARPLYARDRHAFARQASPADDEERLAARERRRCARIRQRDGRG